ncbi:MAG TPA: serine protease, partial [Aestuariivirga sp.]
MMRLVLTLVLGLGLFASPVVADTVAPTAVPLSRPDMLLSFAPLVKRTAPAVVNVYAKTIVRQQQQASPFDDPIFKHFFPQLQLG